MIYPANQLVRSGRGADSQFVRNFHPATGQQDRVTVSASMTLLYMLLTEAMLPFQRLAWAMRVVDDSSTIQGVAGPRDVLREGKEASLQCEDRC